MALIKANDAAEIGDFKRAIELARDALLLNKDSPIADLAEMQVKEWTKQYITTLPE